MFQCLLKCAFMYTLYAGRDCMYEITSAAVFFRLRSQIHLNAEAVRLWWPLCHAVFPHSSGRRTGYRWERPTEARAVLLHRLSASPVCLNMLLDPSLSGRSRFCTRRALLCWEAARADLMHTTHQVVRKRLGRTARVVSPPDGNDEPVVHNSTNSFIKPWCVF